MFFDSHCHLTAAPLAEDFEGVLERARAGGVTGFLNIGDEAASSLAALQQANVARQHGFVAGATAGVHPQHALDYHFAPVNGATDVLRRLCQHQYIKAVGEIGLDFVYDETHPQHPGAPRDVQEQVFRAQLELAIETSLPVVIHNREADEALLRVVGEYRGRLAGGVFHCFGSSVEVARRVLDAGFHLGFTGLVTFKNAESVREAAKFCPLDRLLIETDAPYLAPVPHRGKTNEPSYLPRVAETVAALHGIRVEELAEITTRNTQRLFGLNL